MFRFIKNRRKNKKNARFGVPTKEETGRNGQPLEPLPEEGDTEEELDEEGDTDERGSEKGEEDGVALSDTDSEVGGQEAGAHQVLEVGSSCAAEEEDSEASQPQTQTHAAAEMGPGEEEAADPLYAQVLPRRHATKDPTERDEDASSEEPLIGAVGGQEEPAEDTYPRTESPSTAASSEPEVVIPMERESDDDHVTVRKMPFPTHPHDGPTYDDFGPYQDAPSHLARPVSRESPRGYRHSPRGIRDSPRGIPMDTRNIPRGLRNNPRYAQNGHTAMVPYSRHPYEPYDPYMPPRGVTRDRGPSFQLRMDGHVVAYFPVTPTSPGPADDREVWAGNGVLPSNRALTGSCSPKSDLRVSFKEQSGVAPTQGQGSGGEEDYLSVGSEASDVSESELRPPRLRVRRTLAILLAWICMGMYSEVTGPTLPYLMSRVHSTHETMARVLASRGAGTVIGSLVGGLLCERFPHWLDSWLSSSLLLAALATAAAPWCTQLLFLSLALGTAGFAKALLIIGSLTQLFRLWEGTTLEVLVFLLHSCYGLGAVPMVQLGKLFDASEYEVLPGVNATRASMAAQLVYSNGHGTHQNGHGPGGTQNGHSKNATSFLDLIPRPMYPFDIAAVATFLSGAVFLMFFGSALRNAPSTPVQVKKKEDEDEKEEQKGFWANARMLRSGSTCGCRMFLWMIVLFCLPVGLEKFFGHYLYYYAELSALGLPKEDSMLIQTIFWASYALCRLVTPLFARCVAPNGLLITCLTVNLVSTAVLCVYGEEYPIFLWIFSALIGAGVAPIFPGGVTWANVYLNQGAMGISLAVVAYALADTVFSWAIGFLLEHFPMHVLVYLVLACAGACFLLYLPIIPRLTRKKVRISRKKRKDKHKRSKKDKKIDRKNHQ